MILPTSVRMNPENRKKMVDERRLFLAGSGKAGKDEGKLQIP
jgi:hypothetical protein